MTVEVFSDIACPFCYIGERHFEDALSEASLDEEEVTWRWRPFQLQPDLPAEGRPWRSFAEKKFGSWARAQELFQRVEQMGEAAGLAFHFDRMTHAVNTTDAHRLVLWAAEETARGRAMARALFAGYFTEGRHVGDRDVLAAMAGEAGFDEAAARDVLASERFADAVDESQQAARRFGVTGVPFYIFRRDGEQPRAVSGAQPVSVFRDALAGA